MDVSKICSSNVVNSLVKNWPELGSCRYSLEAFCGPSIWFQDSVYFSGNYCQDIDCKGFVQAISNKLLDQYEHTSCIGLISSIFNQ
jgi:hypothetical protein